MPQTRESLEKRKARCKRILAGLRKTHSHAECALKHESALQLLISTILSAQSTDETVNRVTRTLYEKYKTADDFNGLSIEQLEEEIRATGFFRQKAKSVKGACRILADEFDGQVPDTMEDLIRLPGVARKTANVVLGTWFKKNEGVVVDTHVGRLAHRMGLTWTSKNDKDAAKIEQDLMQLVPRKQWTYFSHAMIWHGRRYCMARKPDCARCKIAKDCPSAFTFNDDAPASRSAARKKTAARLGQS